MPNFNSLVKDYVSHTHYMGEVFTKDTGDDKRVTLIQVLNIRKKECALRFKLSVVILIIAVIVLLYSSLFYQNGVEKFKEISSLFGGSSILALVYYLVSLRDEITKINQTIIIASAVDNSILNTMLLALSADI